MVPDLCKSPGGFISSGPDPACHFFRCHFGPDIAKIIELFSRVGFSFPRLVSNREGLTLEHPVHHFIKTLFDEVIAALGHRIHRVFLADGKTFYLDDIAGIHGGFHVVTGDTVFSFVVIDRKIGATGTGILGTARMKVDGGHRCTFEQAGRVDPGRDKRDQKFALPVQYFRGQFVFPAAGKDRGLGKMSPDIIFGPAGIIVVLFPKE